jgi:hypothetical protein
MHNRRLSGTLLCCSALETECFRAVSSYCSLQSFDWTVGECIIKVYGTLDDAGDAGWDVQPLAGLSFILSQVWNPNRIAFTVSGVPRFRVGVRPERRGAVLDTADFSYRIETP